MFIAVILQSFRVDDLTVDLTDALLQSRRFRRGHSTGFAASKTLPFTTSLFSKGRLQRGLWRKMPSL
ncbi:MAG: hypothetical protein MK179_20305, partial [Pirellulaceae bacterium]|nr:hypothetical protein [Pirellulaceae bacterium]